jgi:hypothetical protein
VNGGARPCSQEPFLTFGGADAEWRFEGLAAYIADEKNKHGRTTAAHANEIIRWRARDARVFFYFIVAHLHHNSLIALAIFQHFCEAYVGVYPSLALFRYFYSTNLDVGGAISGSLIFRLHP